jgi:hypothetical protein
VARVWVMTLKQPAGAASATTAAAAPAAGNAGK